MPSYSTLKRMVSLLTTYHNRVGVLQYNTGYYAGFECHSQQSRLTINLIYLTANPEGLYLLRDKRLTKNALLFL